MVVHNSHPFRSLFSPVRRSNKSAVCRSHCMYACWSSGESFKNHSLRPSRYSSIPLSMQSISSDRRICGGMPRWRQITSSVSSRTDERYVSMAWMVAFAMPSSSETSAWDLGPRSARMFFDRFFDRSTEFTSA